MHILAAYDLTVSCRGRCEARELGRVAGQRWNIEESFQAAKGQGGLDEHQVRTWTSWHRWTVLCSSRWHSWPSSPPPRMTARQPRPT